MEFLEVIWGEPRFFISTAIITFASFCGVAAIEVFVLKLVGRLDLRKNLYYAIVANALGFLITAIISVLIVLLLLVSGAAALGGVVSVALGGLVGIIVLVLLCLLLIFFIRFFLFRFFDISETKFRIIYSSSSTVGTLIMLVVFWAITMMILSAFIPNL